jgi:hypothetical protein
MDDPDNKRSEKEILSKRYFSVNLGNAVEVGDVFYVQYLEGSDVNMIYMDTPLWTFKALPSSSTTRMREPKSYRSRTSAAAFLPWSSAV